MEFATVFVQNGTQGSVADSLGFFNIERLCPGQYHIQVNHIGCAPAKFFISLERDTSLAILLDHHSELLREIVVAGIQNESLESQTQHAISSDAIRDQAGNSLSEITEIISGVRSIQNGSGISKPVIHGLFGNRIAVVNNGLIQAGQQWGSDHAPEVDPNAANLITVVKGSDAVEYGSQALGGAVIIEAGPIVRDPHIHGNIGYAFNSNGLGHTLYSRISKSHNKIDWRWTGSLKKEGDHRAPDYFLTNTGATEANASLQFIYRPNEVTNHQFYYSLFNTTIGVFAGSHISNLTDLEEAIGRSTPFNVQESFSYAIEPPKQHVIHHLFKYSGKTFIRNLSFLEWHYGLQSNHREEFDIRRGGRSGIPALDLQLWTHEINGSYSNNNAAVKYKSGIQTKWTDNTNNYETGILPLIPDYQRLSTSIFVNAQIPLGKVIIETGGRYDLQSLNVWAISGSLPRVIIKRDHLYHDFSIVAGLKLKQGDNSETRFHNMFVRRSPEVNELYSSGLHQGVAGIEEGDWTLKPETSFKSILTQAFHINEVFHFELTAYSHLIYQYIFLKPEDELRLTIRGAFPVYTYQQEDAWIRGIDMALVSDISHRIEWSGKLSFIKGETLDDKMALSLIPPAFFFSSLSWAVKDSKTWKGTKIEVDGEYTSRQNNWDHEGELLEPPDDYFLLGVKLETSIQLKANILYLRLQAENVMNVTYRNYLNRLRYFADEEGRNVRINLRYEF